MKKKSNPGPPSIKNKLPIPPPPAALLTPNLDGLISMHEGARHAFSPADRELSTLKNKYKESNYLLEKIYEAGNQCDEKTFINFLTKDWWKKLEKFMEAHNG
jgi:hypothetical protein